MIDTRKRSRGRRRGQSEPLAALLSVAAVCFAVSIYAGVVTDVVPEIGSDRAVGEPAAASIWQDVSDGGIYDRETDLEAAVDPSSLPGGYYVDIEVTVVTDAGSVATVGSARFDGAGRPTTAERPRSTEIVERPVSVRLGPGDVRPGRLTVEVWR